ncbi:MAG: helix-turn-helix domain-containing protein [Actinobacteria bacterium]|nr:helix-turn-helix domain-containing protein [Actinomycetota bacterium]
MGMTLDEYLAINPGNPEKRAKLRDQMLAEVHAYRLRELREAQELTQTDVAEVLEVSQRRVSEIERGQCDRIKLDTLRRYVQALGGTLRVEAHVGERVFPIL